MDELAPHVGDIISFGPGGMASRDTQAQIAVMRGNDLHAVPCILDVRIMMASGGSLVIEAAEPNPDRSFRVHWAGPRTSADGTDCGRAADMQLSRTDIGVLDFAVGLMGATGKEQVLSSPWSAAMAAVQ